jgi:hypothetical protein
VDVQVPEPAAAPERAEAPAQFVPIDITTTEETTKETSSAITIATAASIFVSTIMLALQ